MVLCIECDAEHANQVMDRVKEALTTARVSASVGMAMRTPENGLYLTAHNADQAMYVDKSSRKGQTFSASR